jgi:hypothetical protein
VESDGREAGPSPLMRARAGVKGDTRSIQSFPLPCPPRGRREDQRNWGDVSFNAYCTPFREGFPRLYARGTHITYIVSTTTTREDSERARRCYENMTLLSCDAISLSPRTPSLVLRFSAQSLRQTTDDRVLSAPEAPNQTMPKARPGGISDLYRRQRGYRRASS